MPLAAGEFHVDPDVLVNHGCVVVSLERHVLEVLEFREEALRSFRSQRVVAQVVDAARLFLASVVRAEDGKEFGDDLRSRGGNHKRRNGAVIHAELGQDFNPLSPGALSGKEENLLLHPDVLEQPGSELAEGDGVDAFGFGQGAFQDSVEAAVIGVEESVKGAGHRPRDYRVA